MRERHRHHAEERRERRDENGAQSLASALHDGVEELDAAFAGDVDVVDQHDGVVDHDTDEQDDADVGAHAERGARGEEREGDAASGEGQREHDEEGVDEGLELPRHHHVDEKDAEDDHHLHGALGLRLLLDHAGVLDLHAVGDEDFAFDALADVRDDVALRTVDHVEPDCDDALLVLAADCDGAGDLLDFGEGVDADALARG